MKYALLFVGVFFGGILVITVIGASGQALTRLTEWVKRKTGKSDTQASFYIYAVFVSFVIAAMITSLAAARDVK